MENYVKEQQLLDAAFKAAGLEPFILHREAWDPHEEDGWPTLEWMQKENKRLVIFNALEETSLAFTRTGHVIENQWGTLHPRRASKERKESRAWRRKSAISTWLTISRGFAVRLEIPIKTSILKGLSGV